MIRTIIHIGIDDKFIDSAIRVFESVAPGQNQLIIIGKKKPLEYIKESAPQFLTLEQTVSTIQSPDCAAVIFHSLGGEASNLLSSLPKEKPTAWLGWGFDYYDSLLSPDYPDGLLLPETKALLSNHPQYRGTVGLIRRAKSAAKKWRGKDSFRTQGMLEKLDFFSPVLDMEYQRILAANTWFKAQYICWNYGTLEDDLLPSLGRSIEIGRDILVGNSATPENNHLEIFKIISELPNLNNCKVIVPLSYGDEWYKHQIVSAGEQFFGERFVPLTEFLNKDKYISVIGTCGFVFMNHLRQQALGNICIMMLHGAKIFLNEKNPLFSWLQKRGAIIAPICASLESMQTPTCSMTSLTEAQRRLNTEVITNHWARKTQYERTRALIDKLLHQKVI